jgi:hypothetical protein
MATIPQITQTTRLRPTLPDPSVTPFGDIKIPEPRMN